VRLEESVGSQCAVEEQRSELGEENQENMNAWGRAGSQCTV